MRALSWLVIVVLAVLGQVLRNDYLTTAIVPVALILLWLQSPRALRGAIAAVVACACAFLIAGGVGLVLEILPALIAALAAWVFARSLLLGRTPLIARAIAAMEGALPLRDPAVARYAACLTAIWAIFQGALALFGVLCVAHAHALLPSPALPPPSAFCAALPAAIAALFLAEFLLRPSLLPQVRRYRLLPFVRDLVRVWPDLIED